MAPLFAARDYRRPRDAKVYEVCWCSACTYGRVAGQQSPAEVAAFYDIPYYTHQTGGGAETPLTLSQKLRLHLAWRADRGVDLNVDEGVGSRMLDVGCGGGGNLQKFSRAGYEVTGVEPDAKARSVARRFGRVYEGTAEALPEEIGDGFDTVLFSHVLEHCIDPATALRNARRVIAPKCRLIVEVPNNEALAFSEFKQLWPWTDLPRHLHFFTEQSLSKLLAQTGFRMTRVLHVGYTCQFHPEWIRAQERIWGGTQAGATPRFDLQAWALLAKTWLARPGLKYASIRVHAQPI